MSQYAGGKKITWQEFKALCEAAGIQDDDEIDSIDISWGDKVFFQCTKDEDFGWNIRLPAN